MKSNKLFVVFVMIVLALSMLTGCGVVHKYSAAKCQTAWINGTSGAVMSEGEWDYFILNSKWAPNTNGAVLTQCLNDGWTPESNYGN